MLKSKYELNWNNILTPPTILSSWILVNARQQFRTMSDTPMWDGSAPVFDWGGWRLQHVRWGRNCSHHHHHHHHPTPPTPPPQPTGVLGWGRWYTWCSEYNILQYFTSQSSCWYIWGASHNIQYHIYTLYILTQYQDNIINVFLVCFFLNILVGH